MSSGVLALVLLVSLLLLIGLAVPVAVAIAVPTFLITMSLLGPDQAMLASAQRTFTGMQSFTLLAIPFFVLAGGLMNQGGIATRLMALARLLVGRMPGGLAHTNIAANALFGALSGSSIAAASAIGTVAGPEMRREGYPRSLVAAVNAASAPAGMLIPPSNVFIVYSLVSSSSIAALFMAGVVPGIIWAVTCSVVVLIIMRTQKIQTVKAEVNMRQAGKIVWDAFPSLLMIIIVIGGILTGMFTATESSAIAVLYSLVLGFVYRTITVKDLPGILLTASRTTGLVMIMIGVTTALSWLLAYARIPDMVRDLIFGISTNGYVVLLIIMVILLIVGTFMDSTPAVLIFTPVFLPIVTEFGVSPIQFGAMMVFNLCIGLITPPVGNVLFVGARIGQTSIESVFKRIWPFIVGLVITMFFVVFVPAVSLGLPAAMGLI